MRVDTSNLGYKYFGHGARKPYAAQWLGCVETDDGEQGALALNPMTGGYLMFRHGGRPIELEPMAVLQALAEPVRLNPPGRKPSEQLAAGDVVRVCTVTISEQVRDAARAMGEDNLSRGLRLAVEYVYAFHGEHFAQWRASSGR
jgi:hypothetical protein